MPTPPPDPHAPYEQRLVSLLKDSAGKLSKADIDAAIDEAVNIRFSCDRPRTIISDVTGNDSNDLPITDLEGQNGETWESGFSVVKWVEFPVGNVPESFIDPSDWRIYCSPTETFLRLLATVPQDSDTLRVTWTVRHTPNTVPAGDFEAVCAYCAALCFEMMAASYIQTVDQAIAGDTVNYRTKAQECLTVAKAHRKRYFDHIGIADSSATGGAPAQPPAMATGHIHEELQPGFDRILHNKYQR